MKKAITSIKTIALATVMVLAPTLSVADGKLSAEQITKAVSDHTYQGSMTKDAFVEYYSPDGTIRGKNYSGKWRTMDNVMCFQYGDKPENCWKVTIKDAAMTMHKDGVVDGNGMLIKGNFFNF